MMILVTSASGANGDGYGQLLAFSMEGVALGAFSNDRRIVDPRGLRVSADRQLLYVNSGDDRIVALDRRGEVQLDSGRIPGLNAGGGNLGPDERYYVGLRMDRTIAAFTPKLDGIGTLILKREIVPFPRGFAFADDGELFLASGIGPDGQGANTILRFTANGTLKNARFVDDGQVSPLDLAIAPDGNVLVSSEFPFGSPDAVNSIRAYDRRSGALVRVFSVAADVPFRRPRGLRFGPNHHLYCVAQDAVIAFDYENGHYLGAVVSHPRLHGQAIEFFGE
jgi:DNA-binding beta-propeller fold protein YncE